MDIKDLVNLHHRLSDFLDCFRSSGVPEIINEEDFKNIEEVQKMLEKMVVYMKKRNLKI